MTPRDFALLAQEAYTAAPDIGKADSASRAIVRDTAAGVAVAFPGTNNLAGWLADLDIDSISVPGVGEVHHGFWRAWQAISVDVLAAIAGRPVIFVGHSLGAAIAIMAAVETTLSGNPPAAVWGFEPPRVSMDLGVRTLLAKVPVTLTKKGNDLVTYVPPGCYHAALLRGIGRASRPFPNVADHELAGVIAAFSASPAAAA